MRDVARANKDLIFDGEWMVPHTLKTYLEDVWKRFWIFDVFDRELGRYLVYEDYAETLVANGLHYVEPLWVSENPGEEQIGTQVEMNTYLIADGAGLGEGVVAKNYAWTNVHGRQPWAKVVRHEFKERNKKAPDTGARQVEAEIVEGYVTPAFVAKTRATVVAAVANDEGIDLFKAPQSEIEHTFRHRIIPQLLGRVYHDLVTEEAWTIVKKWKYPVINFKLLQGLVTTRVKELARDLF